MSTYSPVARSTTFSSMLSNNSSIGLLSSKRPRGAQDVPLLVEELVDPLGGAQFHRGGGNEE